MATRQARSALHFDSPEQEVFLNLWRTYDCLRALEEKVFGQYDLTAQQYNVLRLLGADYPGSVPTLALASRLITRAPDITRMLDKLEQRGLISRERPADNRRVVNILLTAAGLKLLDELKLPVRQCHDLQLGHLSPAQLKRLSRLLKAARHPHENPDGHWQ